MIDLNRIRAFKIAWGAMLIIVLGFKCGNELDQNESDNLEVYVYDKLNPNLYDLRLSFIGTSTFGHHLNISYSKLKHSDDIVFEVIVKFQQAKLSPQMRFVQIVDIADIEQIKKSINDLMPLSNKIPHSGDTRVHIFCLDKHNIMRVSLKDIRSSNLPFDFFTNDMLMRIKASQLPLPYNYLRPDTENVYHKDLYQIVREVYGIGNFSVINNPSDD